MRKEIDDASADHSPGFSDRDVRNRGIGGPFGTSPTARAAIPAPCPSAPGVPGGTTYHIFATLPIGVPAADGICVQLPGFPVLNSGAVTQAPPACPTPPPATDAGGTAAAGWVWVDWGIGCVSAGQSVVLQFQGPPGLTLGRVTNAATWSIMGGGTLVTDATVWPDTCPASPPGVGGVPLLATAIAPAGGPYDGVCMRFVAPIPGVHSPTVLVSPPTCPTGNTVVGAAVLQVWDDFTTKCANAGDPITVEFWGPPGLVGPCPGCATWLDGAVSGDVTVTAVCAPGTDPDADGDIDFCDPGPGQPCVQDHASDDNHDGYSDADEFTPPGSPPCMDALPMTGGYGTDPTAGCPGRAWDGTGTPPDAVLRARSDIDLDGSVTIVDLSIAAGAFLHTVNDPADVTNEMDVDQDQQITIVDLSIMAGYFLNAVPSC